MAIGIALARGNVVVDGISNIQVSMGIASTTPKCYSFGELYDGKLTLTPITQKDSQGRNCTIAFTLECEAKLMYTSKTNCLKILDYLSVNYLDFVITAVNGTTYTSGLLTNKHFGFSWTFDSSKDVDGIRFVQIKIDRKLLIAEIDTLIGSNTAILAYNTADAVIALLESQTVADRIPAGVTNYSLAPTGAGLEDIGVIRNAKLQCELQTSLDNLGRSVGHSIKLHTEVEGMQAKSTELALADNAAGISVDHSLTLMDGTVFKSINKQGIGWEFHSDKDTEDVAFIKFTGDGTITNIVSSAWDGLFT